MNVAGAVLCGGASRRMGADKALIEIDGTVMAERVALALVAAGCQPVVFVGGDEHALRAIGRPVFADRWPGAGPVGGVVTALSMLLDADSPPDSVVVCACDLPDVTPDAIRDVIGIGHAVVTSDVGDVRVADSGRLEPMLACWRVSALPRVQQLFESGHTALHAVVGELALVRVPVDPDIVRNLNLPVDLRKRPARTTG